MEPAEENVAQSESLPSLGNECPWQANTLRTKLLSRTTERKNVGKDYGNVVTYNYSLSRNINCDLHRLWMPKKTITRNFRRPNVNQN